VEFVFIALVVFVPLIYIVAGFSAVQRGVFASTAAAREAGRAMATAPDPATGQDRALRAAALAVEDRAVDATDVRLAYAAAGVGCAAGRRRVHTDAHAGGGVLDVRDGDRADPECCRRSSTPTPPPASSWSSAPAPSTAEALVLPSLHTGRTRSRRAQGWSR
jgi:hypothetical protein